MPVSVYGGVDDACTWAGMGDMTESDTRNRWLVAYGDGSGLPAVNLVVLSFVHPLKLIALARKATADWLKTSAPVLDYANATVPNRQPNGAVDAQTNWQESKRRSGATNNVRPDAHLSRA